MTLYIKLVPSSSFPSTTYTHTVVRLNFDHPHFFQPMISYSTSLLCCDWLKDGQIFVILSRCTLVRRCYGRILDGLGFKSFRLQRCHGLKGACINQKSYLVYVITHCYQVNFLTVKKGSLRIFQCVVTPLVTKLQQCIFSTKGVKKKPMRDLALVFW